MDEWEILKWKKKSCGESDTRTIHAIVHARFREKKCGVSVANGSCPIEIVKIDS